MKDWVDLSVSADVAKLMVLNFSLAYYILFDKLSFIY